MLKKAGFVAATAAGLIALGAPAFASTPSPQGELHFGHHGYCYSLQCGLVNIGEINIPIWVDILSPGSIVGSDIDN